MKLIKRIGVQIISTYLFFVFTWLLILIFYPYINPITQGLPRVEAVREIFSGTTFYYSFLISTGYFALIFFVSAWLLKKIYQFCWWGAFLGVYIGLMYMPSYTSHNLSLWFEKHIPKFFAFSSDLLLLIGVPLVVAFVIQSVGRLVERKPTGKIGGHPLKVPCQENTLLP